MTDKDFILKFVRLDPSDGSFVWLMRSGDDRITKGWNSKYAGKRADNLMCIGYRRILIHGRYFLAHRVVWLLTFGEWPENEIDHIDCDPANNRIQNLRPANRSQQNQNQRISRRNKAGIKGVFFDARDKKWVAKLNKDGRQVFSGYFSTSDEAKRAYAVAATQHFGAYARVA